jgi:hypothetical protein
MLVIYRLVCFTHYKFCFKSRRSSNNLKVNVPTKPSVEFQTFRFQIEEIGGRSPSICRLKRPNTFTKCSISFETSKTLATSYLKVVLKMLLIGCDKWLYRLKQKFATLRSISTFRSLAAQKELLKKPGIALFSAKYTLENWY